MKPLPGASPDRPSRRATWRALGLALLAGVAAGLTHPPFGVLPGLLGFAALLMLLERADTARPLRSAFARGWTAGLGYFLVGLWWIGEAFLVDIRAHGWMAPFAILIMPAGMALFWGAAGMATRLLVPSDGPATALRRALVFAAVFGLFEWLRGHVLTGFPWNLPGEVWRAGSAPSQLASVVGAYGLSVLTLALAALPAAIVAARGRERAVASSLALALLIGLYGFGALRLSTAVTDEQPTQVRVVQGDIDQRDKWRAENLDAILDTYLTLTTAPRARPADVVIWPEGAVPAAANDYLGADVARRTRVAAALRPGQTLLTGAYRVEFGPAGGIRAFNTLVAVQRIGAAAAPDLALTALYDKHRLVPFGEFLPLRSLLAPLGIDTLVHAPADFTSGPKPAPIAPPGVPRVQPLICYESLFPGFTSDEGGRPLWIVNVSNDAWFGRTSGPWQHLNIASYRALEEGLPMIRATPTGVSAIVDAYGRTIQQLPQGVAGVIDAALPAALPPTFFARYGDRPFWALVAAGLLCSLSWRRAEKFM